MQKARRVRIPLRSHSRSSLRSSASNEHLSHHISRTFYSHSAYRPQQSQAQSAQGESIAANDSVRRKVMRNLRCLPALLALLDGLSKHVACGSMLIVSACSLGCPASESCLHCLLHFLTQSCPSSPCCLLAAPQACGQRQFMHEPCIVVNAAISSLICGLSSVSGDMFAVVSFTLEALQLMVS